MMIALDKNGDFETNSSGQLIEANQPEQQNYIAEVRCMQTEYSVDLTFGKNYLTWTLSQSPNDRINDLIRIGKKYLTVNSIRYKDGVYNII